MRMVYIANVRMPTEKAHGYQIAKMCEAFADINNVQVELIAQENKKEPVTNTFSFYNLNNNFKISTAPSIRISGLGKYGVYLQKITFAIFACFVGLFKQADIVYTRHALIVNFFYFLLGKKVAIEFHEPHKRFIWYWKLILKFVKKKIVVAYRIADLYKDYHIDSHSYAIIPNGVDIKIFNLDISKAQAIKRLGLDAIIAADTRDKQVLLYTGSFKTYGVDKGINDILTALRLLKDEKIVFFAVGGSEDEIQFYQAMAVKQGVLDKVYLLGRQTQTRLAIFQKLADILLMPFPRKAHFENYMTPLKMFEFMASQRPIIASNLASVKAVLNENNCVFCKPDDPDDLADKILFLINNQEHGKKIAEQAFKDVQEYTWEKRAKKIIDFINKEN